MTPRLATLLVFTAWLAFIMWVAACHPNLLTY